MLWHAVLAGHPLAGGPHPRFRRILPPPAAGFSPATRGVAGRGDGPGGDDLRSGSRVRAARIRRGWRQRDLAVAAHVSPSMVSRIERGHLEGMSLDAIRRVAAALEIRGGLLPRSRAADPARPPQRPP